MGEKSWIDWLWSYWEEIVELLKPFNTENFVYDPYLSRHIADIYEFTQTSLEYIMSNMEVIICLAPLTPKTKGMIGSKELNMIKSGSILVNVSRGPIIETDALIERLSKKDIIASLDVFDPEPIPVDSPVRKMEMYFYLLTWQGWQRDANQGL